VGFAIVSALAWLGIRVEEQPEAAPAVSGERVAAG
jgi:hypothetical protein